LAQAPHQRDNPEVAADMDELRRALSQVDQSHLDACHIQISDIIRSAVTSRELEAGIRLPSERELVAVCGVSRSTIRIALDRLVHERVIEKRPGKGIFIAQSIRRTVGCVAGVSSSSAQYPWPLVMSLAMVDQARRRGHEPGLYILASDRDSARLVRDVEAGHLAGIMSMVELSDLSKTVPLVVAMPQATGPGCFIDYEDMGYKGTSYLARDGRRRISLAMYPYERKDCEDFLRGYRRSLSEFGLSGAEHVVRGPALSDPEKSGAKAVEELLSSRRDADGIVFMGGYYALGGVKVLVEHGVAVPSDIMVATHVNLGYTLPYPAPVVRLEADPARIAAGLVQLLEAWWSGQPPAREILGIEISVNPSELL
jgi:DNA-binding LacI/PurR family transcriptional regulator